MAFYNDPSRPRIEHIDRARALFSQRTGLRITKANLRTRHKRIPLSIIREAERLVEEYRQRRAEGVEDAATTPRSGPSSSRTLASKRPRSSPVVTSPSQRARPPQVLRAESPNLPTPSRDREPRGERKRQLATPDRPVRPDPKATRHRARRLELTLHRSERALLKPQLEDPEEQSVLEDVWSRFLEAYHAPTGVFRRPRIRRHDLPRVPMARRDMLSKVLDSILDLNPGYGGEWGLNCMAYAAARCLVTTGQPSRRPHAKDPSNVLPIEQQIRKGRKLISWIQTELNRRASGAKPTRRQRYIRRRLIELKVGTSPAKLHSRLAAEKLDVRGWVSRARRERRKQQWDMDNAMFAQSPKKFYASLAQGQGPPTQFQPPSGEAVEGFWREIFSAEPQDLTNTAHELVDFREHIAALQRQYPAQEDSTCGVTDDDVITVVKRRQGCKAPGPDGIPLWIWKHLNPLRNALAELLDKWWNGQAIPAWIVRGHTLLLPKAGKDLSLPGSYRPITLLNTTYTVWTSILNRRLNDSLKPILADFTEQRGAREGTAGVVETLLIDKCAIMDAKRHRRNLFQAFIDFKKAYDSISHPMLTEILTILAPPTPIIRAILDCMSKWATCFTIDQRRNLTTPTIQLGRGVFQGDSLSPRLFTIALLPLTVALRQGSGYTMGMQSRTIITHQLYMDDIKLYSSSQGHLNQLIHQVEKYGQLVGLQFGLEKCAQTQLWAGRPHEVDPEMSIFRCLSAQESYKYLGIPQGSGIQVVDLHRSITEQLKSRTRKVWRSGLNARFKAMAHMSYALGVLGPILPILPFTQGDLLRLEGSLHKTLTRCGSFKRLSTAARLHLPRGLGGRGIPRISDLQTQALASTMLRVVLKSNSDTLLNAVMNHDFVQDSSRMTHKVLFPALSRAVAGLGELHIEDNIMRIGESKFGETGDLPKELSRLRQFLRKNVQCRLEAESIGKPTGFYWKTLREIKADLKSSYAWLGNRGLRSQTEALVMAMQEDRLTTKSLEKRILKKVLPDEACRICGHATETLAHILTGCEAHGFASYLARHNRMLWHVYSRIRVHYGADPSCQAPRAMEEVLPLVRQGPMELHWDRPWVLASNVPHHRPDLVLVDHDQHKLWIFDGAVCAEPRLPTVEREKVARYQPLALALSTMDEYRGYNVAVLPLVVGARGGILSLRKHLESVPMVGDVFSLIVAMQRTVQAAGLTIWRRHLRGIL